MKRWYYEKGRIFKEKKWVKRKTKRYIYYSGWRNFLFVSNNVNSIFEENTYSFVCSGYSKMMYDENGDNIIYKNDTGVKVISKKDYFAKLNKIIKQ